MFLRPPQLPLALLLAGLTACGGSDTPKAAPSTEPISASVAPSPSPSQEPSREPTASKTPAQVAARQLCENSEIIDRAFSAFIKTGPSPALAEQVGTFTAQLATYKATFSSDPKGAPSAQIVGFLERQGPGWTVLYGEGETAYQTPKANGNDVDILSSQIEEAWPPAMTALGFTAENAPHAPVVFADGDC